MHYFKSSKVIFYISKAVNIVVNITFYVWYKLVLFTQRGTNYILLLFMLLNLLCFKIVSNV